MTEARGFPCLVKLGTTPERIKEELLFFKQWEKGNQRERDEFRYEEDFYYDDNYDDDYYDSTEEFLLDPFELTRVSKRRF